MYFCKINGNIPKKFHWKHTMNTFVFELYYVEHHFIACIVFIVLHLIILIAINFEARVCSEKHSDTNVSIKTETQFLPHALIQNNKKIHKCANIINCTHHRKNLSIFVFCCLYNVPAYCCSCFFYLMSLLWWKNLTIIKVIGIQKFVNKNFLLSLRVQTWFNQGGRHME